jgi:hypothetical protein
LSKKIKRNVSVLSTAALGTLTIAGGVIVTAGVATAAVPQTTVASPALTPSGATATPIIRTVVTPQPVTSEQFTITNTFNAGDVLAIDVGTATSATGAANTGTALGDYVQFSSAPTVTVTGGGGSDVAPTFTETLAKNALDGVGNGATQDELDLKFNSSSAPTNADTYTITVSGIAYLLGGTEATGAVNVSSTVTSGAATAVTTAFPSDASIGTTGPNANSILTEAPTGVETNQSNVPVSNVVLTATPATPVPTGFVTIAPTTPGVAFSGTATITATNGGSVAAAPTSGVLPTSGTGSVTVPVNADGDIVFAVVGVGTGATYTVSGLTVTTAAGAPVGASPVDVTVGANPLAIPDPVPGIIISTDQPALTVLEGVTASGRVAGATADATAAAAAELEYPGHLNGDLGGAVILASDAEFQDALSASYLGNEPLPFQQLGTTVSNTQEGTPVLLNPPTAPAAGESTTAAVGAIRALGASTVYIIGGTDAISPAVATQLSQIEIGQSSTGTPELLQVVRIAGTTSEATAADVAQFPTTRNPDLGTLPATPGAYGVYNSGASESTASASTTAQTTAILADANEFQDALAGSPLAYDDGLPVLLTPTGSLDPDASAAISNLGITQVIVLGGTSAVSANTVTQLEALGVSVLRIAGTSYEQTSTELASFETSDFTAGTTVLDGLNVTGDTGHLSVGTSRGDAFTDALSSAQDLQDIAGNTNGPAPLLLTAGTGTLNDTTTGNPGAFLSSAGTSVTDGNPLTPDATPPKATGGFDTFGIDTTIPTVVNITGDLVFGGTLAQTPALVQSEFNAIAAG